MKQSELDQLFLEELKNIYSAEQKITEILPIVIGMISLPELKEAVSHHLKETKSQIKRLKKIFSILKEEPSEKGCKTMEGILHEAKSLAKWQPPILDAAIISALQKVEHYEIASYGTLRSFAKHLSLSQEVIDLLQESLDEEGAANKKLTKIAVGSFFSSGVNKAAANVK